MKGNENPQPIVDGTEEIVSAVFETFIQPKPAKQVAPVKPPIQVAPQQSALDRFLGRVPADLRDKVTVQVGATKVSRPGQKPNLSPDKAKTLDAALDNPELVKGSVKILGENNETLMQIAGGEFTIDKIGFGPQKLELEQPPLEVEAPTQAPAIADKPDPLATPQESERMIEIITRLESRVAALETQIKDKPVKLNNNVVGSWLNQQRDRLATTVRQNVDKVALKGYSIADKIAATKDAVVGVAGDYRQAATTAVEDLKQSFEDGKTVIVDGATLVKGVATQGAKDFINDGMSRHYEAMDGLTSKVNNTAANVADGAKTTISDPRQAFMDKVLQPTAQRMFQGAEKLNKVEPDTNGNQSVVIGPYRYSKESTGIVLRRGDEVVNAANLSKDDVASVENMRAAFPTTRLEQKLDAPKLTGPKHKVSI